MKKLAALVALPAASAVNTLTYTCISSGSDRSTCVLHYGLGDKGSQRWTETTALSWSPWQVVVYDVNALTLFVCTQDAGTAPKAIVLAKSVICQPPSPLRGSLQQTRSGCRPHKSGHSLFQIDHPPLPA